MYILFSLESPILYPTSNINKSATSLINLTRVYVWRGIIVHINTPIEGIGNDQAVLPTWEDDANELGRTEGDVRKPWPARVLHRTLDKERAGVGVGA